MTVTASELIVDKEFQNVLPTLSDQQLEDLETNVLTNKGFRDAVVYWQDPSGGPPIIADGMNRMDVWRLKRR